MKNILSIVLILLSCTAFADIKFTVRPILAPYSDAMGFGAALGVKSDISSFVTTFKPGLFTGLELMYSAASYTNLSFGDLSIGVDAGYRFFFLKNISVAPYVTIGAAFVNFRDVSTNVDRAGLLLVPSVNVEYFLNRNLSFGLDAGYGMRFITLLTNPYTLSSFNISLTVSYSLPMGPGFPDGPSTKEQKLAVDLEKIMKDNKMKGSVDSGSQSEIKMSLSDVLFESDSDQVTRASVETIRSIAKKMREYPDMYVSVEGHSDDRGDEIYNALLSAKRAKNVADLLIAFGVSSSQVSYKGWGREKPLVPNISEANRSKNRRVEIRFKFGK